MLIWKRLWNLFDTGGVTFSFIEAFFTNMVNKLHMLHMLAVMVNRRNSIQLKCSESNVSLSTMLVSHPSPVMEIDVWEDFWHNTEMKGERPWQNTTVLNIFQTWLCVYAGDMNEAPEV